MAGPEFRVLESLTLSARADVHPLKSTLPFSSRWVSPWPARHHNASIICEGWADDACFCMLCLTGNDSVLCWPHGWRACCLPGQH